MAIAAIMLMFATVLTVGCKKENKCDCNITEGDWVDLGLPSGLLWATRNVGASSPTEYGDYFAWGETSPKSVYDNSSYKYYVLDETAGGYRLTKYCVDSSYGYHGFTDGLTTLQPGDDAATVNYGGRTPTKEEWQEMVNNTTNRAMKINGVWGKCFMGPNGNCIFLPIAGIWVVSARPLDDGWYWSSSLVVREYRGNYYHKGPWYCHFGTANVYAGDDNDNNARCYGLSVRAVSRP